MRIRRSRYSAPIVLGIALSLTLHFGVIVPALVAMMTARTDAAPQLDSDFDAEDLAPPPVEQDKIDLGKPESERSTLVWLGHDEYEEHRAALSAIEQAALDDRPFGGTPSLPAPPAQDVPQNPTADAPTQSPSETTAQTANSSASDNPLEQPSETEVEIAHETPSDKPTVEATIDAPDAQPTPLPADRPVAPQQPAGATSAPNAVTQGEMFNAVSQLFQNVLSTAQQVAEEMAQSVTAGKDDEHAAPQEAQASASSAKPENAAQKTEEQTKQSAPAPRVTASAPAPNPDQPGEQRKAEQSDSESDASSITDVSMEDIKIGKPLATKGLELKPRKPTLTNLIRMTALPGNPLCEIRFQRNGKPSLARLLSSSGDSRVDDAVLASLYRWRAEGPELDALGDDETLDIRIRIIMNAR